MQDDLVPGTNTASLGVVRLGNWDGNGLINTSATAFGLRGSLCKSSISISCWLDFQTKVCMTGSPCRSVRVGVFSIGETEGEEPAALFLPAFTRTGSLESRLSLKLGMGSTMRPRSKLCPRRSSSEPCDTFGAPATIKPRPGLRLLHSTSYSKTVV
jgi:hypothetical protein